MTLNEKNQLIAEFMGSNTPIVYSRSWDYLMPVVKECKDRSEEFQYDDDNYLHYEEELFHPDYMLSEFLNDDIMSIFERVVEFIQWYNNLK